jgi:hypothetical protein
VAWARLDDRFWSNRKIRRAWKASRASIGLHVMAMTYCAMHDLNGDVDIDLVEQLLPQAKERDAAVSALLDAGLWEQGAGVFVIHDYLEFNASAERRAELRAQKAARQQRWRDGQRGRTSDASTQASGDASVDALRDAGEDAAPKPKPKPKPVNPPDPPQAGGIDGSWTSMPERVSANGGRPTGRRRDHDRWQAWLNAYCHRRGWPTELHTQLAEAVDQAIGMAGATTDGQVDEVLATHFPRLEQQMAAA